MMQRHDYAFPFRIDGASRQAAQATSYDAHVEQMMRQLLLTSPGERANMPEYGCGLRRLLFAPNSQALEATTQLVVLHALQRWLSEHVEVKQVIVQGGDSADTEGQLLVRIEYVLRETQTTKGLELWVR